MTPISHHFYGTLRLLLMSVLCTLSVDVLSQTVVEWRRSEQHPVHAENHHYQDSEGYMWYGTLDGLCRDDGYTVELFSSRSYPALANNYVLHLTEDFRHRLWIGTMNGVYILDKKDYNIVELADENTKNCAVTQLFTASDGSVYVGVKGFLYRYSDKGDIADTYDLGGVGSKVSCMIEDESGNILLGMEVLCRLDVKSGKIERLPYSCHNPASIIRDVEGQYYWMATSGDGVVCYNPAAPQDKNKFSRRIIPRNADGTPSPYLLSIVQDNVSHDLWVTSMDNIFTFKIQDNGHVIQADVPSKLNTGKMLLYKMLKDKQGDIWVSALDRKSFIITFQRNDVRKYPLPNPLESMGCNPMVSSLCIDDAAVWYGLERFGLYLYDKVSNKTTHYSLSPSASRYNLGFVKKIIPSHEHGKVWIMVDQSGKLYCAKSVNGTIDEVEMVDLRKTEPQSGEIQSIYVDSHGRLWIGTTAQLFLCHTKDNNHIEKILDAPSYISGISQTPDGVIWAACRNKGVYRIDEDITFFPSHHDFTCIASAADNSIWLGTGKGELLRMDTANGNMFSSYTAICGVGENGVGSLYIDSFGYVWIVTNRTLHMFNPTTKMVRTYTVSDSSIDMERFFPFATTLDSTGIFCVGGSQGIVCINPTNPLDKKDDAYVNITSIKAGGKNVFMGQTGVKEEGPQTVYLKADSRNLSISFSSLDYLNTSAIRYAYRIIGVDEEWNYTQPGQNQAFYNTLPTGKNLLEVKATNKDGIWCRGITHITINREPFWYETYWAKALYVIVTIVLLAGIVYILYRRSKLQQEHKLETQMEVYKSVLLPNESGAFRLSMDNLSTKDKLFLDTLTNLMEENMSDSEFKVENMAALMAMSRSAFFKRVKDCIGFPPKEYLRILRLNKASELLSDSSVSVADVAYKVGFDDALYFSKCFKSRFGISPTAWQKEHSL